MTDQVSTLPVDGQSQTVQNDGQSSISQPTNKVKSRVVSVDNSAIEELKKYLNDNVSELRRQGYWLLITTLILSGGVLLFTFIQFYQGINSLIGTNNPNQTLAWLIFRSSALTVAATTIIFYGSKFALASFDQSTRFVKRRMGTLFLEFLYAHHEMQLAEKITMEQLMKYFEIWNKTIESAFSVVKVEKAPDLTESLKQIVEIAGKVKEIADGKDKKGASDT